MEKSDHYYTRKHYMTELIAPTISQVRSELGDYLAEAFFTECPDPLKQTLGLSPMLKGAGDDLWTPPSDILLGKVCLQPPLTSKHMKALTHKEILIMGSIIEQKYENECELKKQKALADQEEMFLFLAELQKRQAVLQAHKQAQKVCEQEKEQMRLEFEIKLLYELSQLEKKLKKAYDKLMKFQKQDLDLAWESKLKLAVAETVKRLTAQCKEDLAKQEEELFAKFKIEIKKENIKRQLEVEAAQEYCQETFLHLRHQLECKNIANIMYVLCTERSKCKMERANLEALYKREMEGLQELLIEREEQIAVLKQDCEQKLEQIATREDCLAEIYRQFQKFINFALRATPTQAEFLLSLEKLMIFDLAQTIAKTQNKHRKHLVKTILSWRTESEDITANASRKIQDIAPKDYHQCHNEIEPLLSEHSLLSNDYLPAFYYNKFMYVREDFRNMMSCGIEISPSNLIWNKEVEHFTHLLKRTEDENDDDIEEKLIDSQKSYSEGSVHYPPKRTKSEQSRRSTVQFKEIKKESIEDLLYPSFQSSSSRILDNASDYHNEISNYVEHFSKKDWDKNFDKDCCAKCVQTKSTYSQAHLYQKEDVEPTLQFVMPEAGGILGVKDSLIKHRMSLRPTQYTSSKGSLASDHLVAVTKRYKTGMSQSSLPKSQREIKTENKLSKLSLTRDSTLVHKQSLIIKRKEINTSSSQQTLQLKKCTKQSRTSVNSKNERRSLNKPKQHNKLQTISRLILSKNSLELMRSQSMLSGGVKSKRKQESRESVEIKNGVLTIPIETNHSSPFIKLADNGMRTVKMSHIEILPIDECIPPHMLKNKTGSSKFKKDMSIGQPWLIYNKESNESKEVLRDNFLTKPNTIKIIGDQKLVVHLQKDKNFNLHRANSVLGILKKHSSLIGLFTSCTK